MYVCVQNTQFDVWWNFPFWLSSYIQQLTQSTKSKFCFFGYLVCVVGDSRLQLAHIFSRSMTINRYAETVWNVLLWDISENREQNSHTRMHKLAHTHAYTSNCICFPFHLIARQLYWNLLHTLRKRERVRVNDSERNRAKKKGNNNSTSN